MRETCAPVGETPEPAGETSAPVGETPALREADASRPVRLPGPGLALLLGITMGFGAAAPGVWPTSQPAPSSTTARTLRSPDEAVIIVRGADLPRATSPSRPAARPRPSTAPTSRTSITVTARTGTAAARP